MRRTQALTGKSGQGLAPTIAISRDVVVITVEYRNHGDTAALLQSLARLDNASSCEVIVVDNSSPVRPSVADEKSGGEPFFVHRVNTPRNLYYWGGAAFAIDGILKTGGRLPRWLIVCNNDVTIGDAAFLERLAAIDPIEFPVIAPAIMSLASSRDQNPLLAAAPTLQKRLKWRIYDLAYPVAKAMLFMHRKYSRQRARNEASTAATPSKIYAPHGAFVIFSSAFFERGGKLDTEVPMFAEELSLAETARGLDMPIWHFPDLKVMHAEHSTTGPRLTREKYAFERMARQRYYRLRDEG